MTFIRLAYPAAFLTLEDAIKAEDALFTNEEPDPRHYSDLIHMWPDPQGRFVDVKNCQDTTFFQVDYEETPEEKLYLEQSQPEGTRLMAIVSTPPAIRPEIAEEVRRVFEDVIGVTSYQPDKLGWYFCVSTYGF